MDRGLKTADFRGCSSWNRVTGANWSRLAVADPKSRPMDRRAHAKPQKMAENRLLQFDFTTGARLEQLEQRRGFAPVIGNPLKGVFLNDEWSTPLAPKLTGAITPPPPAAGAR